jgi:hypothetical protein
MWENNNAKTKKHNVNLSGLSYVNENNKIYEIKQKSTKIIDWHILAFK